MTTISLDTSPPLDLLCHTFKQLPGRPEVAIRLSVCREHLEIFVKSWINKKYKVDVGLGLF